MPPSVEYTGGAARVDHIGLGLELEYRVFSLDLPTELRGTLHGPAKPGELVTFTIPGFEGASELVAQLVDASLKPIAETQFDWSIGVSSGNSSGSSGGRSRSDAKGIVHIPLVGAHAAAGPRQLMLSAWSDPQSEKRVGGGYASLPLPPDFTHGSLDLGELILAPFGSPSRFARMDDEGLQRAFGGSTEGMNWRAGPDAGGPLEEMLAEMVRRGSASFETCITERLAAVRADKEQQHSQRIGELELLTALRRLQHKPDPLHLVLGSESVLDVAFPASPTVAFDLKNVEASESFEVAEGGSYRSGRFARCSVEAVGPDGKRLPPREWDSGMGGGMFSRKQLAPGETLGYGIPLADYVEFLAPGEYRVRIHYHDKEDIDSVKDLAGWIVSSSDEFVVHVQPLRIHVAQSRVDEMRGWIRAIDASKPVPLVSAHWHAGMEFRGEAQDPEDKLFRAGFEAMPALLAAMDDPATEPERRAWVFGMLWNILGIEKPTGLQHYAAIGTMNWIGGWPTCMEDGQKRFGEFGTMAPIPVEAEKQRALAESWHRWSRAIEITIER